MFKMCIAYVFKKILKEINNKSKMNLMEKLNWQQFESKFNKTVINLE